QQPPDLRVFRGNCPRLTKMVKSPDDLEDVHWLDEGQAAVPLLLQGILQILQGARIGIVIVQYGRNSRCGRHPNRTVFFGKVEIDCSGRLRQHGFERYNQRGIAPEMRVITKQVQFLLDLGDIMKEINRDIKTCLPRLINQCDRQNWKTNGVVGVVMQPAFFVPKEGFAGADALLICVTLTVQVQGDDGG